MSKYMSESRPELIDLVKEAIKAGMPLPVNWIEAYRAKIQEAALREELTQDSASPEKPQESEQAEDDPAKEVRDDCDSQTTEDCHGGQEATRSVEKSPSVAENGQEDRDSDQTQNSGEDDDGTGKNGTETTGTGEENGGSDGTGSGHGDKTGTDSVAEENQDTSEQDLGDEAGNKDTAEAKNTKTAKLRAVLGYLEQNASAEERYSMETPEEKQTMQNIYNCIVDICKSACKGVRSQQTKWDTRAMVRDICGFRRDRVLRDKLWNFKPRKLAIFWDQSGSCDWYFAAVANALKEVAGLGYRCWLYDCSNGLAENKSVVTHVCGPNQTTEDGYNNGPRLRRIANRMGCNVDRTYIKPNQADFIKICHEFDVVIVLQDYDYVESVWFAARKIEAKKCPHFIDLDDRYNHPAEHDWNPHLRYNDDYPVHDHWHKVVVVSEE